MTRQRLQNGNIDAPQPQPHDPVWTVYPVR